MQKLKTLLTQLRDDEGGATMIEYSVLIGLVTVLIIVTIGAVGDRLENAWTALNANMLAGGMT